MNVWGCLPVSPLMEKVKGGATVAGWGGMGKTVLKRLVLQDQKSVLTVKRQPGENWKRSEGTPRNLDR